MKKEYNENATVNHLTKWGGVHYEEVSLTIIYFDTNVFLNNSVSDSFDNQTGDFSGGDSGDGWDG